MDRAGNKGCVVLSKDKRDFIEDVRLNKPNAVLVHGPAGSGKSMLGVEAAKVLIDHLRGKGPETKVYFCHAASGDTRFHPQLLPSLRTSCNLPAADDNTKYIGLWDLCKELNISTEDPIADDLTLDTDTWMEPLKKVARQLSSKAGEEQTVLFADEVTVKNKSECDFDWMDQIVEECPNITIILCLKPVMRGLVVKGPVGDKTATIKLQTQFRFSPNIQKLLAFLCASAGEEKPTLPEDITDLPDDDGELPIWFHAIDKKHVTKAMSEVKNLVGEEESVSLICNVGKEDVGTWCKENGINWPPQITDNDCNTGAVRDYSETPGWKYHPGTHWMNGCEDQTVVVVGTWPGHSMKWREYLSRARRRLYLVTREGEDDNNHKNVMKWLETAEQQGLLRKVEVGENTYVTIAKMEEEVKRLEEKNSKMETDKEVEMAKMQEELKVSRAENDKLVEDLQTMKNDLNKEREGKEGYGLGCTIN